MSKMSQWVVVRHRLSGKWQAPLFLCSMVLLGAALLRMRPSPTGMPLEKALPHLSKLVHLGHFEEAISFGEILAGRVEFTELERAPVHLWLARAWHAEALRRNAGNLTSGRTIAEHYKIATTYDLPLPPSDLVALGQAYEWLEDYDAAVQHFERAISLGVEEPLELRQHLLALRLDRLSAPARSVIRDLDALLGDAHDKRPDLLLWAVDRRLRAMDEDGSLDQAPTLLARNHDALTAAGFADHVAYFEAWLLYRLRRFDEAESYLRSIRNRLRPDDDVYAMTGWLLGRVVLRDEGPQRPREAASVFDDVLRHHPRGAFGVASRVGRGESLALLERHEEALLAFRDAMQDLNELESPYPVDRHALRVFLSVLSDGQRRQGRMAAAVDYARLAVELIDEGNLEQSTLLLQQLASSLVGLGDELAGDRAVESDEGRRPREVVSEQARRVLSEAAETFLEIAQRNVLKEALSAEAHWRAAELSARAGDRDRAVSLFRGFVQERPHHSLVGRALLRIGQMLQTSGRLEEAIAAYRECFARFPRGLDGSRALVPLAQCYLAMGPDHWELAERTLRIVLEESEVFTPQAPEFVDALFLMGDALNRSGQCERAIAVLEEAMERYPDEPRVMRARYLLADSYRRSGLGLKQHAAEARYAGEIEQIGEQATQRLQSAQQVYRRMIQEYESRDPADLDRLDRIHLRHAYLYEADCYFETQEYRRALKLYEDAAAMYKDSAAAPGAYVQIINCHVFLGETDEARAALARARVLVDALPEQVFDGSISPETRSDWRRYFAWLNSSELF